jgi:pimeloyl-ACP methyl ester carboxylesterase
MALRSSFSTSWTSVAFLAISFGPQQAVALSASSQLTSFNSSFALSQQQIADANFTLSDVESVNNIINWDVSQYAGGPTTEDTFYNLPTIANGSSLSPGTLIKVEDFTNITTYSLSTNLALSRILYQSRNLNGSSVPTSAFILWPFTPRQFPTSNTTTAPVVIWTHPTSGFFGPSAPSKHRVLFAGDNAPFALALAGYAVVAPDYAGLGVAVDFEGKHIPHQYIASTASANDAIFSYQAARTAFPDRLGKEFVVMGQSQGGGVAWGTAELLAKEPALADGYLGAVAVSPTTDAFSGAPDFIAPFISFGINSVFSSFKPEEWLTPFGLGRANVYADIKGGLATVFAFFTSDNPIALPNVSSTWEAVAYGKLANAGSKAIKAPMLVIQGTEDAFVPYDVTTKTVADTCELFPGNQIQYTVSNGTGHVPTLDASRQLWMRWIEERFEGKAVEEGVCGRRSELESFLPIERYQAEGNSFVQWAGSEQYSYEVPLAL